MLDARQVADALRDVRPERYHVVTLPDFFLDHFVRVPKWVEITPRWADVHRRGGGNVPTPGQSFQPGGNAANTALALARLGARVHFVTRTSAFGLAYMTDTLGRAGVDLKHAKADGQLAVTTAIEFQEERPSNVMLSDAGSVAQYGPEALDANDWTLLEAADLVLVANWSQNRRGTPLVEAVAAKAKRTMLDTADPSASTMPDAPAEIRTRLLPLRRLDVFAMNENELRQLAMQPKLASGVEERNAARLLSRLRPPGSALDLHTARFAATYVDGDEAAAVPTFRVDPLRVTGAGDAWNAGDILGHLAGLAPAHRLALANAVAGLYVSGKEGVAPTLADAISFLDSAPPINSL